MFLNLTRFAIQAKGPDGKWIRKPLAYRESNNVHLLITCPIEICVNLAFKIAKKRDIKKPGKRGQGKKQRLPPENDNVDTCSPANYTFISVAPTASKQRQSYHTHECDGCKHCQPLACWCTSRNIQFSDCLQQSLKYSYLITFIHICKYVLLVVQTLLNQCQRWK